MSLRASKLLKMSPHELGWRISCAVRRRRERRLWPDRVQPPGQKALAHTSWLCQDAVALLQGVKRDQLPHLKQYWPPFDDAIRQRSRARAQAALSGSWPLLGFPVDLAGTVDWHRDPRTGYRWPRTFYADVPLGGLPDGVDVKYVWELARHQYAVELARAWLFGHGQQYASRARELILDWIDQNPLYEGVHWTSALEVAMRAISWIWTLATLADWDGWQDADLQRIAASLADHATYLEHHLSLYSSPYNHLIGEATALYLIG
ncbi:MAG TPA: hypothetical protein EYH32_05115, partial [Anaerolineae bacterium]|nr:hypothetical protein [Anaerolineae bacterium]